MIKDGYEYMRFDYLTQNNLDDVVYYYDKQQNSFSLVVIKTVFTPQREYSRDRPHYKRRVIYAPNGRICFLNAEVIYCDNPDKWVNTTYHSLYTRKKC